MKVEGRRSTSGVARGGIDTLSRGAFRLVGAPESPRSFSSKISTPTAKVRFSGITSYKAPHSEKFLLPTFARARNSYIGSGPARTGFSGSIENTGKSFGLSEINTPRPLIGHRFANKEETTRHGARRRLAANRLGAEHAHSPKSFDRLHKVGTQYAKRWENSHLFRPRKSENLVKTLSNSRIKEIKPVRKLEVPQIIHPNLTPTTRRSRVTPIEKQNINAQQKGITVNAALEILYAKQNKRKQIISTETANPNLSYTANPETAPATATQTLVQQDLSFARKTLFNRLKEAPVVKTTTRILNSVNAESKTKIPTATAVKTQADARADIKNEHKKRAEVVVFTAKKIFVKSSNNENLDVPEPELDTDATRAREKLILRLRSTVLSNLERFPHIPTWKEIAMRMPVHPDKKTISELVRDKGRDGSYSLVRNKLALEDDIYSTKIIHYLLSTIRAVRIRPKPKQKVTSDDVMVVLSDIPSIFGKKDRSQAA